MNMISKQRQAIFMGSNDGTRITVQSANSSVVLVQNLQYSVEKPREISLLEFYDY
jgi:hypothetical protein